jgi:hypothetical protein
MPPKAVPQPKAVLKQPNIKVKSSVKKAEIKAQRKAKDVQKLEAQKQQYSEKGRKKFGRQREFTAENWKDASNPPLPTDSAGVKNARAKLEKINAAIANPTVRAGFLKRWRIITVPLALLIAFSGLTYLICSQIAEDNPCCWQTFKNDPENTGRIQVNCAQASCNCKSSGNITCTVPPCDCSASPTCDSEDGIKRGVDYYWDHPTPLEVLAVAEEVTGVDSEDIDVPPPPVTTDNSIFYMGIAVTAAAVIFVIYKIYINRKNAVVLTKFRFKSLT